MFQWMVKDKTKMTELPEGLYFLTMQDDSVKLGRIVHDIRIGHIDHDAVLEKVGVSCCIWDEYYSWSDVKYFMPYPTAPKSLDTIPVDEELVPGLTMIAERMNNDDEPYLSYSRVQTFRRYNPSYGDHRVCICGRKYHEHFHLGTPRRLLGVCDKFQEV